MMNTDDFRARLSKIMSYYGLSASAFAELIQVQKSSISHVLSGRNKPSLDFILKLNAKLFRTLACIGSSMVLVR